MIAFKKRADGVVSGDARKVQHGGLNEPFVDVPPVSEFGYIASDRLKALQELLFAVSAEQLLAQLDRASGVLKYLNSFRSGGFVEKPTTTGVHQHQVALHFQKPQRMHFFLKRQIVGTVLGQECTDANPRAV